MEKVAFYLQKIASDLESLGHAEQAGIMIVVADDVSLMGKEAQEMILAEETFIKTAIDECAEANRQIEAAKKRKKKWVQAIGLKKGRLTRYKKPGESMEEAAKRALKSDDPSVRGMGSFFMSTKKFKHKK